MGEATNHSIERVAEETKFLLTLVSWCYGMKQNDLADVCHWRRVNSRLGAQHIHNYIDTPTYLLVDYCNVGIVASGITVAMVPALISLFFCYITTCIALTSYTPPRSLAPSHAVVSFFSYLLITQLVCNVLLLYNILW